MTVGQRRAPQSDLPTYRHSIVPAMEVTFNQTRVRRGRFIQNPGSDFTNRTYEHAVCRASTGWEGQMARDIDDLKHLLELEYDYSQKAIDKFDEYRARLKSWMITAAAGITAVAFSAHNSLIFWAGALMVLFFGLSEMSYVDIQEDVIARNRELEKLLDSLSRSEIGPEHDGYQFGLGKVFFRSSRVLRPKNVLTWLSQIIHTGGGLAREGG